MKRAIPAILVQVPANAEKEAKCRWFIWEVTPGSTDEEERKGRQGDSQEQEGEAGRVTAVGNGLNSRGPLRTRVKLPRGISINPCSPLPHRNTSESHLPPCTKLPRCQVEKQENTTGAEGGS